MADLEDVEYIYFCDETKFSINDSNVENCIHYFCFGCPKTEITFLRSQYQALLDRYKIKLLHSSERFSEKFPKKKLMDELCNFILLHRIKFYSFKYSRDILFDVSKSTFGKHNNDLINFDSQEFQALFYFITCFNTYLDHGYHNFKKKSAFFFDRNVFGVAEPEKLNFPEYNFLKTVVFVDKVNIDLLGLVDFFGYIFRKAKISKNEVEAGNELIEKSRLTINSYYSIAKLGGAGLFLDLNEWQANFLNGNNKI